MICLETKDLTVVSPAGSSISWASASTNNQTALNHTVLLERINFQLEAGEILSVIGPNGAGKSTLIKAINGDMDYSGKVLTPGLHSNPKLRARQIATLPQLSLLNFPFKVSEVVQLARIPHSSGISVDQKIVSAALQLLDIGFLANRLYTDLSGGEKQRVQLARVLAQVWREQDAQGPRMVLLDEPMTALDLGHQQALMHALSTFAEQGVAVLMVLHDVNLAARYSNKLLALLCSQQIAFGATKQVLDAEMIRRLFGIEAQITQHPVSRTPMIIQL